jgi:hypothetical protein
MTILTVLNIQVPLFIVFVQHCRVVDCSLREIIHLPRKLDSSHLNQSLQLCALVLSCHVLNRSPLLHRPFVWEWGRVGTNSHVDLHSHLKIRLIRLCNSSSVQPVGVVPTRQWDVVKTIAPQAPCMLLHLNTCNVQTVMSVIILRNFLSCF